jgi:2-haloacid dehalogenase
MLTRRGSTDVAEITETEISSVTALTFDVIGTVVDWRTSIIREGKLFGSSHGITVDWGKFANKWMYGYADAIQSVNAGRLPWTTVDELNRMVLDELLRMYQIQWLSESDKDELNRIWYRLKAWPDSVTGLERLRKRFRVVTLSNANKVLFCVHDKN